MAERAILVSDYAEQQVWFYAGSLAHALDIECPVKRPFTCGFFMFDAAWSEEDLEPLLVSMIEGGCVAMLFHGAQCERAHDLADRIFVKRYEDGFGGPADTLMTSGLEHETLLEAAFDLFCATPTTEGFINSGYYVLSFGSTEQSATLQRLLEDPSGSIRRWCEIDFPEGDPPNGRFR